MTFYTLIPLFSLFICVIVVTNVFAHKSPTNRAFLLYAASISFYLIKDLITWSDLVEYSPMLILRVGMLAWMPPAFLFLHFVYVLLEKKRGTLYYFYAILIIAFCSIGITTDLIMKTYRHHSWGVQGNNDGLLFYPAVVLTIVMPGIHALIILFKHIRRTTNPLEKKQFSLLFIGSGAFFICALALSVIIPEFGLHSIPEFGGNTAFIQLLLVYYALKQYRFMNIGISDISGDLFSNVNDGIIVLDDSDRVLHANPKSREILDISADSTIHFDIQKHFKDLDPNKPYNNFHHKIKSRDKTYNLSLSQSTFTTRSKQNGRIIIFKDVTQQEQTEKELSEAQKRLIQTARQAGMAEVATNVLHNVGNVLNSVNVSGVMVLKKLNSSSLKKLPKLVASINDEKTDFGQTLTALPRGQIFRDYMNKLSQNLITTNEDIKEEIRGLLENVEHIKNIISQQQKNARAKYIVEAFYTSEIINTAIELSISTSQKSLFSVEFDPAEELAIESDKSRVLQILANLITNSKYSLIHSDHLRDIEKQLTIHVKKSPPNFAAIEVTDNGVGIGPEAMQRVFEYGYTTKKEGHGFGLHHSALAARELGGELKAHSEGTNKGATFTLVLPIKSNSSSKPPPD